MISLSLMAMMLSATALNTQEAEVLQPAAVSSGQNWNVVSRSSSTVYMLDINSQSQLGGEISVNLARVPASGGAADKTHSVTIVVLRCSDKHSKSATEIYYAANGSEEERIDNDYEFEPIVRNSLDDYVKSIVCDGDRSATTFNSVDAFISAGRPSR